MTTTLTTPAGLAHVHESSHTRTATNTDADGCKTFSVATSSLSLHWRAGELRLVHRFTSVPVRGAVRAPARGMRNRL